LENIMTEDQIKYMANRFLTWKLPENFHPDGGVSFEPVGNKGTPYEYSRAPVGTNLLTAEQAEAMIRHLLEGLPSPELVAEVVSKHGDPEAFGERELIERANIQKLPYGTKLYAA
jgi:hypothetical protein